MSSGTLRLFGPSARSLAVAGRTTRSSYSPRLATARASASTSVARMLAGRSSQRKSSIDAIASEYGSSPVAAAADHRRATPRSMHCPKRMLGSDMEVPRVAEESSEIRGEQPNQLPASALITVLRGVEQRLEPGRVTYSKPAAPSVKEFAMTLKQVDAGEPQRQSPRSIKLFVG